MTALTKETAWIEMLELTSQKGWEDDKRVLKRLDELRPYYGGSSHGITIRLIDSEGNYTDYPTKTAASLAIGMSYNGISSAMRRENYNGYVKGYKVEVLGGNV